MNTMEQQRRNMNREERLVVETEASTWDTSPGPGSRRMLLESDGNEKGEMTAVVRYEPGSLIQENPSALGEDVIVLEGEFADQDGSYPAGTYLRTPPGASRERTTEKGCTLFVKRSPFSENDTTRVQRNTNENTWLQGYGMLRVFPLHEFEGKSTALVLWPPGAAFQPHKHWGGEEIFVLDGTFQDEHGNYPRGTWLRNPHLSTHNPFSENGCLIMVKVGHLA